MIVISKKLSETINLGKKLIKKLKGGEIIILQGDLGAGKTALVKGMALELGIKKPVRSPTFNLMRIYTIKKNSKIKKLIHVDCYRLKNTQEIIEIGLLDYLNQTQTITAIEWPEKISPILKKYKTTKILLESLGEEKRKITIK